MNKIIKVLDLKDRKETKLILKYIICRLYLALIYYTIGNILFKSPVLSFYIILSKKVRKKDQGL
jgi:hypothetical protein